MDTRRCPRVDRVGQRRGQDMSGLTPTHPKDQVENPGLFDIVKTIDLWKRNFCTSGTL